MKIVCNCLNSEVNVSGTSGSAQLTEEVASGSLPTLIGKNTEHENIFDHQKGINFY